MTPWTTACQASLSITNSQSFHVHWVGDASQPFHPLLSPAPPAFNLSQHQGPFYESVLCIRWPKYWSFSFSISPSNEYAGLISFRINWFDLHCSPRDSQESSPTPQFKSINLWHSAFLMVQFSHPYMTTGKTIALTRWTFLSKVMSLLCNMLSRFVIAFFLRSKHLLISWLQSPSAMTSVTVSIVYSSTRHDMMGLDTMILVFWMLSQLFHSPLWFLSEAL